MRAAVGLICLVAIAFLLAEFFVVFLLPRRVKRDPRLARGALRTLWKPWRWIARRLPRTAQDTMLGVFGPLGLLAILGMLSIGVIVCYSGLLWSVGARFAATTAAPFGQDLYFSAAAFVSASTPSEPSHSLGKVLQVVEAANGLGFLAIAIGYLPALFQAFSRRETAVSRLDPRAGSPPTAGALLEHSAGRGGWHELDEYLHEWETWTAELMETHLSYPILGYFRSQHVNQNWLAALTTVVDASAFALAFGPEDSTEGARMTFRLGRHALADLAHALTSRRTPGERAQRHRLSDEGLTELLERLEGSGLHCAEREESRKRLEHLRGTYELYAFTLSRQLALDLPDWVPEEVQENWRAATRRERRDRLL